MINKLIFSTANELIVIPYEAVVYVDADGNYSNVILADGTRYMLTMQLGQVEQRIAHKATGNDNRFIRIGRSLIVNRLYINYLNPTQQKLVLSDCRSFRHEVTASRDALKALKEYIEMEVTA